MKRLDELPDQKRIVEAFAQKLAPADSVSAAFVGGSIGARRADRLSDVDLALVYETAAARDEAWQRRSEHFGRLGNVLFVADADHVGPHLQVGVVEGPVLVDLAYRVWEDLKAGWWYQEVLLLRDDDGRFAEVQRASRLLSRSTLNAEELTNLTRKFWRWAVYMARDIVRGEPIEVLAAVEFVRRNALLPLAAIAAGLPTDRVYRFDRLGSGDLSSLVHSGQPASLERADLEASLGELIEAFLQLRGLAREPQPHEIDVSDDVGRDAVAAMLRKSL